MNTLLAPEHRSLVTETTVLAGRTPRPTVVDRLAMRVALRLLLWSTRPVADDRAGRIRRHALDQQLAQRERGWERRRLTHTIL